MIAYAHVWMCMVSMDMYGCVCSSMHVYVCMNVYEYVRRCVSGICLAPASGTGRCQICIHMYVCRDVYDCLWACMNVYGVYG